MRETIPKLLNCHHSWRVYKAEIDHFIQRFERYARENGWAEENWAISLGTLLTGKAFKAYTRPSEEDTSNYVEL